MTEFSVPMTQNVLRLLSVVAAVDALVHTVHHIIVVVNYCVVQLLNVEMENAILCSTLEMNVGNVVSLNAIFSFYKKFQLFLRHIHVYIF